MGELTYDESIKLVQELCEFFKERHVHPIHALGVSILACSIAIRSMRGLDGIPSEPVQDTERISHTINELLDPIVGPTIGGAVCSGYEDLIKKASAAVNN